jgi:hypothetical protein
MRCRCEVNSHASLTIKKCSSDDIKEDSKSSSVLHTNLQQCLSESCRGNQRPRLVVHVAHPSGIGDDGNMRSSWYSASMLAHPRATIVKHQLVLRCTWAEHWILPTPIHTLATEKV